VPDVRLGFFVVPPAPQMSSLYDHSCTLCPLHERAKTVCVEASGQSTRLRTMIVGEAPGRNEDELGVPFIGRAGRLLDRALHMAFYPDSKFVLGRARRELFVTNAVKCRPQNNDNPDEMEIDACVSAYLTREIEAVNPTALLALGNVAAQALLGETGVSRLREEWHRLDSDAERYVLVTYHPAYVLYRGGTSGEAWPAFLADVLKFAQEVLHGSRGQDQTAL